MQAQPITPPRQKSEAQKMIEAEIGRLNVELIIANARIQELEAWNQNQRQRETALLQENESLRQRLGTAPAAANDAPIN